ncbi:MAG: hypothetical protein IJN02_02830 [Bacteroidales bacterium]|nr:hypothetical protein [Bacteroidales bacterium]
MKKTFILISLAAAVLFSCAKPELDAPVTEEIEYNSVLTAKIPETKVGIDDAYTKLTWSNGDKISVLTSSGVYREFVYTGTDGATSAEFKGTLHNGETISEWAIYPSHANHTVVNSTGQPRVYLPNEYEWNEGQVMGPMVAVITDGKASFTHAGGLFAFDVKNVPAGTDAFRFYTSKLDISGITTYEYEGILKAGENDEDGSYVDMKFDALTAATDMKFYIPVPTGSYEDFSIYFHNSNHEGANEHGNVFIRKSNSINVIEAATVKVFTVAIEGGVWYVTESGTTEADGLSWASATTLSNALSKAKDGDVIYVGAGTYVPDTFISGKVVDADDNVAAEVTTATEAAHKAFIVDKNVTIIGGYPAAGGSICNPVANKTILSGNDVCNHVVLVAAPKVAGKSVKMSGFTVTKAASTNVKGGWQINETNLENYTGAMAAVGTELSLSDMTFTGNKTVNATGIYGSNSKVDIKNCSFTENTASANGTVWFTDGSELTFSDSEISNNTANNAAGLYLYLSAGAQMTANVSNVTITNNTATTYGGGAYLRTATAGQTLNATLDNCVISNNTSKEGAIMKLLNVSGVTIKNSVMSGNTGGAAMGGVLMSEDASATYQNCSFTNNIGKKEAATIIKAGKIETTNKFDRCIWKGNTNTSWGTIYVLASSTYADNVVITNSLFDSNSAKGRGGAIYARTTGTGGANVSCVNTTFHNNDTQNSAHGTAVLAYSGNAANVTTVDLISCTITKNHSTGGHYAVYAENAGSVINLYNSLIANNIGSNDKYNVNNGSNGVRKQYYCQNGTTYYNADGTNAGANTFDYSTMLGALNADGVCPLLLPESNPAITGGMSPAELAALASANVPASVLAVDQLGNERTGNVIGAWAATSAAADM